MAPRNISLTWRVIFLDYAKRGHLLICTFAAHALPLQWCSGSKVSDRNKPHYQQLLLSQIGDSSHLKRGNRGKEKEI